MTTLTLLLAALAAEPATAATFAPEATSAPVSPGPAAEFRDYSELDLGALLDIQTTASTKRALSVSESPAIMSAVPELMARRYGWESVNQVLERQPGFFPVRDFERRLVGARGVTENWNANHLLLLIDGVPQNDFATGSAYLWRATALAPVEHLEVVRGPGAALYGANAMNGVVNLRLKTAREAAEGTFVRAAAGEFQTRSAAGLAGREGEYGGVVVAFETFETHGNPVRSTDLSYRGASTTAPDKLQEFRTVDTQSYQHFLARWSGAQALDGLSVTLQHQNANYKTGYGWLMWIPDVPDNMRETRTNASLRYQRPFWGLTPDFVAQYDFRLFDQQARFYPNGAFDGWYPGGVWEHMVQPFHSGFARAQLAKELAGASSLLAGVETQLGLFRNDETHWATAALTDDAGGYPPTPGGGPVQQGNSVAWIAGHPIWNAAAYGQYDSGELIPGRVRGTAGVRYDRQQVRFDALDKPAHPLESRTFEQVSPRLGVVVTATDDLTFKLLGGRAFRAPTIFEIGSTNSWAQASNTRGLKPEFINTGEAAADWKALEGVNWRVNAFYTRFANQIAFSVSNSNLSTNVYTLTTVGGETELLWSARPLSGFVNYAYTKRLGEDIYTAEQPYAAPSKGRLTGAPAHAVNAGVTASLGAASAAVSGRWQSAVLRRSTDVWTAARLAEIGIAGGKPRPDAVPAWTTLDARVAYQWGPAEFSLSATNVFNATRWQSKAGLAPFDYAMDGRRVMGGVALSL